MPKKKVKSRAGSFKLSPEQQQLTITEAARLNNVTRQAIYVAIKLKKLRATKEKESAQWTINVGDLEEYRLNKYSRTKSIFNGELLFDSTKGYYSVNQAAEILDVPAQKIYYATRTGKLKASRKGAAWVIHVDDLNKYREDHLASKKLKAS